MTQLALEAPAITKYDDWLCYRCGGFAFLKDATGLSRCVQCSMPRKYATCRWCGNGLQAHGKHGCGGVSLITGEPCQCKTVAPA